MHALPATDLETARHGDHWQIDIPPVMFQLARDRENKLHSAGKI
jgi:hypothetical protein